MWSSASEADTVAENNENALFYIQSYTMPERNGINGFTNKWKSDTVNANKMSKISPSRSRVEECHQRHDRHKMLKLVKIVCNLQCKDRATQKAGVMRQACGMR